MQEIFYEETCFSLGKDKQKNKILLLSILSIAFYVIGFLSTLILYYMAQYLTLINGIIVVSPIVIFTIIGYVINFNKKKIITDYDYTFVSGNIRFSKVYNNISRKRVDAFDCSAIEKLGKYNSKICNNYMLLDNVKKVFLTSNQTASDGKDFYYILIAKNSQKIIYILESSKEFMRHVVKSCKSMVIEEGFINDIFR